MGKEAGDFLCFCYANRTFPGAETYGLRKENIRFCIGKHKR